jgi:hypothetical protein
MKTNRLTIVTLTAAALMLFSGAGWTADDDGEATIRLMSTAEADEPEAVTKQLSIPTHLMQASEEAQQRAIDNSTKGLENAADRGEKKGFEHAGSRGQERSEEARERGAEMSESAKEDRENRGRSENRPEPPEGPPEGPPGTP